MNNLKTKKLAISGLLIAFSVVCSPLAIPFGASKCFPVQHLVNILAAVFLGPAYGVCMAFITSLLRLFAGLGTLLAFPGSMIGALCCGLAYKYTKNLPVTYFAEMFGTGIIGGLLAYPLAAFVLGKEAAVLAYIFPFLLSSMGGTVIAAVLIYILKKTHALDKFFTQRN